MLCYERPSIEDALDNLQGRFHWETYKIPCRTMILWFAHNYFIHVGDVSSSVLYKFFESSKPGLYHDHTTVLICHLQTNHIYKAVCPMSDLKHFSCVSSFLYTSPMMEIMSVPHSWARILTLKPDTRACAFNPCSFLLRGHKIHAQPSTYKGPEWLIIEFNLWFSHLKMCCF